MPRTLRASAALVIGLALSTLAPARALAGAWTLPPGAGQIIETLFGWSGAGAPYGAAAAPAETRLEARTYVEYGLAPGLTLVGQGAFERYALTAPSADVFRGLDYSGAGLRKKIWSNDAFVFSFEAAAFVPGARSASRPAQAGATGGEGEARALAGYGFNLWGRPAFFDIEAAYRWRAAGPPDEWHADITLGVEPIPRLTALLQNFDTISARSRDPEFPAWSSHIAQFSLVYALDEHWSFQAGAFASYATAKTNSERGLLAAVWRKF